MNEVVRTLLEAAQEVSGLALMIGALAVWYWIDERRNRKHGKR